jgi:deoxyribodipyrimidine photolyase-related protein
MYNTSRIIGAESLLFLSYDQLSLRKIPTGLRFCKLLMVESYHEFGLHGHHKKKLVFIISAMRHFAQEANLDYIKTDDPLVDTVMKYMLDNGLTKLNIIRPGQYRHIKEFSEACEKHGFEFILHEDPTFLSEPGEFNEWSKKYKKLVMEHFYRYMRRKTGFLMDGENPIGDRWNFDQENRKPMRKKVSLPELLVHESDGITEAVVHLVEEKFGDNFGDIYPFWLGVTRRQALTSLEHFIVHSLPSFGLYQDAMKSGEHYLLFHSGLATYLNLGLIDPTEVCEAVAEEFYCSRVSIEAAEGFIRQIIGWREFIRNMYWKYMPEYENMNELAAEADLPEFYWTGETDMNCLKQCISHTKKYAYAHHIERLMVTGNFACLLGVNPKQISDWYLCVYADAHQWVELPNTIGMSNYCDGGLIATKPYVCGSNYINKMSDFCKGCKYDPATCPVNQLYWEFLKKHKDKFTNNPRMKLMYKKLNK